jgi:hypothetical protein
MPTTLSPKTHWPEVLIDVAEVASETISGVAYRVGKDADGRWMCDCQGFRSNRKRFGLGYCKHIRRHFQKIEGEPYECWCCHNRHCGLSEHHLWRRSGGGTEMPTVWLCAECHNKATNDKWFEEYLQKLWLKNQ